MPFSIYPSTWNTMSHDFERDSPTSSITRLYIPSMPKRLARRSGRSLIAKGGRILPSPRRKKWIISSKIPSVSTQVDAVGPYTPRAVYNNSPPIFLTVNMVCIVREPFTFSDGIYLPTTYNPHTRFVSCLSVFTLSLHIHSTRDVIVQTEPTALVIPTTV